MPRREFQATLKEMLGLTLVLSLLGVACLIFGLSIGAYELVGLGLIIFALLVAVRVRYLVIVDDHTIRSRTLFTDRTVQLSEVFRFERVADRGYPEDRYSGPYTYEIGDQKNSLRINFKFFSYDCWSLISERLSGLTNDGSAQKTAK